MAGSLKPSPIVIDYQRARYEADERRREAGKADDGPSGFYYLSIWALSTLLFLTAFYVASEAPFQPEPIARNDHLGPGRGLTMAAARVPRLTADDALGTLDQARSELRR